MPPLCKGRWRSRRGCETAESTVAQKKVPRSNKKRRIFRKITALYANPPPLRGAPFTQGGQEDGRATWQSASPCLLLEGKVPSAHTGRMRCHRRIERNRVLFCTIPPHHRLRRSFSSRRSLCTAVRGDQDCPLRRTTYDFRVIARSAATWQSVLPSLPLCFSGTVKTVPYGAGCTVPRVIARSAATWQSVSPCLPL